jgi:hypothetical protein
MLASTNLNPAGLISPIKAGTAKSYQLLITYIFQTKYVYERINLLDVK